LGIIDQNKTMVVGIDVTHPSPGSASNAPSVSAMVASVDKNIKSTIPNFPFLSISLFPLSGFISLQTFASYQSSLPTVQFLFIVSNCQFISTFLPYNQLKSIQNAFCHLCPLRYLRPCRCYSQPQAPDRM
jgi:hypothetical protein